MVRLPLEYQEVEYLESTGTQWIDTNIIPLNLDFEISVDYVWLPLDVYTWVSPFGARLNSNNNRADYVFRYGEGFYGKGYLSVRSLTNIKNDKNRNLVSLSRNSALRNGVDDASSEFNNTYAINYGVYLFSTNNSGSAVNNFIGRIYSAYIKLEDNYAFYGTPCYNKSSGEIGMYDTVSKHFFTNSGTGTFLKGNDVTYDNINLLESRRRILLNTPHIETVSDTIASFKTDIATKIKGCKVYFTPIQEGEGDPSPDNVRPILGWDGVTLNVNGTAITIPFPKTIYGGYVDLVNGEVVEEWESFVLDGEENNIRDINRGQSTHRFDIYLTNLHGSAKVASTEWLCNRMIYSSSSTALFGTFRMYNTTNLIIGDGDNTLADLASFKQWLSENTPEFCAPLATPIHHTIDPQVIRPLKGVNNIYSDANGNIEVKFWTH